MTNYSNRLVINKTNLWKPIAYVIAFTYLFPISIQLLPISTDLILHIISILYLIFWRKAVINVGHYKLCILSIFVIILSLLHTVINQSFDFSLLVKFVASLLFIPSSILVIDIIKKTTCSFSEITVLEWIVYTTIGQAIISLLLFIQPALMDIWLSVMKLTDAGESIASSSAGFRLIAFAKYQFANMAVMYGLALLCAITIAFSGESKLYNNHKPIFYISVILICVAGVLSARTFFIILLLAIIYASFLLWKKKGSKSILYIIYLSVIVILLITMAISLLEDSEYARTYKWAFEWLINFQDNGKLHTDSTSTLSDMYIYPEQTKTWLIGDGLFSNQNGTFYKDTDAGYIRSLFYWGIIGSFIYYLIQYMYFRLIYGMSNNKYICYFTIMLIIWLFLYNIKDMWQANMYWPLLLSAIIKTNYYKKRNDKCLCRHL